MNKLLFSCVVSVLCTSVNAVYRGLAIIFGYMSIPIIIRTGKDDKKSPFFWSLKLPPLLLDDIMSG